MFWRRHGSTFVLSFAIAVTLLAWFAMHVIQSEYSLEGEELSVATRQELLSAAIANLTRDAQALSDKVSLVERLQQEDMDRKNSELRASMELEKAEAQKIKAHVQERLRSIESRAEAEQQKLLELARGG